jgi:hypothetical protein
LISLFETLLRKFLKKFQAKRTAKMRVLRGISIAVFQEYSPENPRLEPLVDRVAQHFLANQGRLFFFDGMPEKCVPALRAILPARRHRLEVMGRKWLAGGGAMAQDSLLALLFQLFRKEFEAGRLVRIMKVVLLPPPQSRNAVLRMHLPAMAAMGGDVSRPIRLFWHHTINFF